MAARFYESNEKVGYDRNDRSAEVAEAYEVSETLTTASICDLG